MRILELLEAFDGHGLIITDDDLIKERIKGLGLGVV